MHPQKKAWLGLNVVGGVAVLASYVHGLATHPETRHLLWGEVPAELQAIYNVTMLTAAAGYFPFSYVFFRTDPAQVRFGERFGFGLINVLYALVLIPSALWLPLTFEMIESPSAMLWLVIRLDLALVGFGAVGLTLAFFAMRPRAQGVLGALSVLGLLAFCLQTAFLDGLVWPAFFPSP